MPIVRTTGLFTDSGVKTPSVSVTRRRSIATVWTSSNAPEDFLRMQSELTADRLWAINQARFEIARIAWLYDSDFAADIVATIRHSQPDFVPGGAAGRFLYRLLYRTVGFSAAERLAECKRTLLSA